jgi:hypothetical protein
LCPKCLNSRPAKDWCECCDGVGLIDVGKQNSPYGD